MFGRIIYSLIFATSIVIIFVVKDIIKNRPRNIKKEIKLLEKLHNCGEVSDKLYESTRRELEDELDGDKG